MNPQAPTQICISIDTEFSIAGHFEDPSAYQPVAEPAVYGTVDGRDEALGFLLETFSRYGITASFFVECANYFFFGDEPMQSVIKKLQAAGQDIQLHVHPIWLYFNKQAQYGTFPQHDDCAGRSYEELHQVFSRSIEVFERWTGHRPLAIRTGSLRADDNVYRVMQALQIPMSSNVAMGVYQPQEPPLRQNSGRHRIHGVMELPVFTYQDMNIAGRTRQKSLQITSCSWPELKYLLVKARKQGVQNIVILTHPFEYIKKSDFQYRKLIRNRVNQQRLRNLCEFISTHSQEFVFADFTSQHQHWVASEEQQQALAVPSFFAIARKLHNRLNDLVWRY